MHFAPHCVSPCGQTQLDAIQVAVAGQRRLHAPQFAESVVVSVQLSEQGTSIAGHWQAPEAQLAPVRHGFPHAPQFFGSNVKSTHAAPHGVSPVGQTEDVTHDPTLQVLDPWHRTLQPPQLCESVATSTQLPPQSASPALHAMPQFPF
jgi:hypothetical protein